MSAVPDNIVAFTLPKKPRIKEKDAPPDQRKVCILPIRAVFDKQMTHGALQALAALCAYCNRAGITWVSQTRLASELGISQQAVAKQFKQLRELGYLETVRRGFKGERTDTLRVIFDPTITAEEAITMTSNKEDTRPPAIREEQERQASQQIDREGQAKIAKLISQALKQPTKPKGYAMPAKGETRAVREVKEAMQKAQSKRSKPVNKSVNNSTHIHNPQVVNEEGVHSQPNHNPEVVLNSEELYIDNELKVIKVKDSLNNIRTVLNNQEIEKLIDNGMTPEQVREAEELIAPLFAAEGLTPSSSVMSQAILQMHRDAR
jgi:predicted transcriptional regulator